jgi:hypothetical protein
MFKLITTWLEKRHQKKKIEKSRAMSKALFDAGLANRQDFCIKGMGASIACVCPSCMQEMKEKFNSLTTI